MSDDILNEADYSGKEGNNPQFNDDVPAMLKDLKSKKVSHPDMRRTYGASWKRLERHAIRKHGDRFTTKHLIDVAHDHIDHLKSMKEETEQLDELSKKTLGSYIKKSTEKVHKSSFLAARDKPENAAKHGMDAYKRIEGIRKATDRLTKEDHDIDEAMSLSQSSAAKKIIGDVAKKTPTGKVPFQSIVYTKSGKQVTHGYHDSEGNKVVTKVTKEEIELDEARRGRPRKDGSKPEGEEDGGRDHIIMQLRKVVNLRGQKKVEFNDDSKHDIDVAHAKKALARHDSMHKAADKQDYANKLAKSHASFKQTVSEAADPSTMRSDRGDVKAGTMMGADGRVKVFKHREPRKPIKVGQVPKYANEEVEVYEMDFEELDEALKGNQHKIDANKNGKVDSHDFKLLRAKKHIKEALKGAQHKLDANKNKRIDSHDFELLRKKKEMKETSEEESLNKLYESLSEDNREKFLRTLETDEGKEALLRFAREQGF